MFRPITRSVVRATAAQSSLAPARTSVPRRFASSGPSSTRRSWKNGALRWGIAMAGIYYYNTSPIFAEQPSNNLLNPNLDALDDTHESSTLETLTSRRKKQSQNAAAVHSLADDLSSENASTTVATTDGLDSDAAGGAAGLEQEAASEGAFNPETGEINWDCPCLGGMAHGPCGPEFKEAFSCFVFSTEEPKGMDCIEKFQGMQQCFQKHPEVYKGELEDDEELDAELEGERQKLVDEIAERRAAQQKDGGAESQPRRLLEEPASPPSEQVASKPRKSTTNKNTSQKEAGSSTASDGKISQRENTAGNEAVGGEEGRESIKSGPESSTAARQSTNTPIENNDGISEGDLIPRASYDARGHTGVPDRETEK